jgi:hydrogenase maturation protease
MLRDPIWDRLESPAPEAVTVAGRELRRGSRVRLAPRGRGDVLDLALAGKLGCVEGIDQDEAGRLHLAVVLDDDPGRDLGHGRFPGHRFFFSLDEVEPLAVDGPGGDAAAARRLLVAGIGNVFLGDDGFGVEVAQELARRRLPPQVQVVDFGIRGMDLVYALGDGHDGVLLVDALPRGEPPGTLTVLRPEVPDDAPVSLDTHGMDPARVLAFARRLGPLPEHTLVLGCEPAVVPAGDDWADMSMQLSAPVREAVGRAADLAVRLAEGFLAAGRFDLDTPSGAAGERRDAT